MTRWGWLCLLVLLVAVGCANTSFRGVSDPPTTSVDIYSDASQITRPYKVMRRTRTRPADFSSYADYEKQLAMEAMQAGADAVLVEDAATPESGAPALHTYAVSADGQVAIVAGASAGAVRASSWPDERGLASSLLQYLQ